MNDKRTDFFLRMQIQCLDESLESILQHDLVRLLLSILVSGRLRIILTITSPDRDSKQQ